MRKIICLCVLLFIPSAAQFAQDLFVMDQQVCFAAYEHNEPYPTTSFTKYLILSDNPDDETQDVAFFSYAQVGSTNYTNLLVTKIISVLERRYALLEINKKRYPIENSVSDSDYPINFLKSTFRYYYHSFSTFWFLKVPYELLEKNAYNPIKLIIVRELYNNDGTQLLDKKEFVYDLIPEQKQRNNRI